MTKNILLTGQPGIGKTTAILRIIQLLELGTAAGFWSREIRDREKRIGFSIETLSGIKGILAHVDISSSHRVGKYGVNIHDIQSIAIPEMKSARESGKLIIIDEIAKMEFASPLFTDELMKCLDTKRVLGTIQNRPYPIIKEIKLRNDVTLIEITTSNRDDVPSLVLDLIKEN